MRRWRTSIRICKKQSEKSVLTDPVNMCMKPNTVQWNNIEETETCKIGHIVGARYQAFL